MSVGVGVGVALAGSPSFPLAKQACFSLFCSLTVNPQVGHSILPVVPGVAIGADIMKRLKGVGRESVETEDIQYCHSRPEQEYSQL